MTDTPGTDLTLTAAQLLSWALETVPQLEERAVGDPKDIFRAIVGQAPLPQSKERGDGNAIIARIIAAPSLDEAIMGSETAALDRILGRHVKLSNPRWFPSEYEGGPLCFCVLETADMDDGIVSTVVIGSVQPQTVIWRAWVEDRFPFVAMFTKAAKPTASGFYPYNLRGI